MSLVFIVEERPARAGLSFFKERKQAVVTFAVMIRNLTITLATIIALMSCDRDNNYDPNAHITVKEQDSIVWRIMRYVARPPDGLSFEERFYKGYDPHYQEQQSLHLLDAYFIDDEHTHYFLLSRRAPSLVDKRVATGGKMKFSDKGKLLEYEEVFRTWKMVPDTLKKRSLFLFDKMVKGESLDLYLTVNSKGVEYIEFPDEHNYYDRATRRWLQK